jgi:hypothetical protein
MGRSEGSKLVARCQPASGRVSVLSLVDPVSLRSPYTEKIHTLITLGIRTRVKLLVFKLSTHWPRGFDSQCPLQSQPSPANANQCSGQRHGHVLFADVGWHW